MRAAAAKIDAPAAPNWATATSIAVAYGFLGAAHSAVSLADGGALAHDDVKLNVLAQSWRAGYLDDNPPLFEWFLRAAQLAVGPVEASFLVLKYGLLALAGVFTFSAAREAVRDPRWAAIAALAMSLNPQIGWAYHEAFTHSAALVAAMALFWWRLLVAIRTGSAADAALLGLALGAGALAKYSFLGAAGAASIAVVVGAIKGRMPMIRVGRMGVLAVATALALVWPHAAWRAANVAQSGAGLEPSNGALAPVAAVVAVLWSIVSYSIVLAIVALLGAWRAPLERSRGASAASAQASAQASPRRRAKALARDATLIGAALMTLSAMSMDFDQWQERYAVPFLFPAIIWLAASADAVFGDDAAARARRRIAALGAVLLAGVAIARAGAATFPGPPFCDACRQWRPYDALASGIREVAPGVDAPGGATLVGFRDQTAGNLRRLFPRARIVSAHLPNYAPPIDGEGATLCLFVWSPDLGPPPQRLKAEFERSRAIEINAPWPRPERFAHRRATWFVTDLAGASRSARSLCRLPASASLLTLPETRAP